MKTKPLTAAQIDTLARRLSETPIEPAISAKKAGDNLAHLLAARIGDGRAALAFTSILTAATAEQAEARLTLVLDYGNTEPANDGVPAPVDEPRAVTAGQATSATCHNLQGAPKNTSSVGINPSNGTTVAGRGLPLKKRRTTGLGAG